MKRGFSSMGEHLGFLYPSIKHSLTHWLIYAAILTEKLSQTRHKSPSVLRKYFGSHEFTSDGRHQQICKQTHERMYAHMRVCIHTHVRDGNNLLKVRGQGLFGEHIRKGLDEEVALKQI